MLNSWYHSSCKANLGKSDVAETFFAAIYVRYKIEMYTSINSDQERIFELWRGTST